MNTMERIAIQFSRQGFENLFTFPNERILFTTRQHPLAVIVSILCIGGVAGMVIVVLIVLSYWLQGILMWAQVSIVCVFLLGLHAALRLVVNWYFHIYVVTTEKIIELLYQPGAIGKVNEVMLEQVRCTEIDVEVNGIINQLFDKGNIIFTFDRPTHQEEFLFADVASPKAIRHHLSSVLTITQSVSQPLWVPTKHGHRAFRFIEDILPPQEIGVLPYGS